MIIVSYVVGIFGDIKMYILFGCFWGMLVVKEWSVGGKEKELYYGNRVGVGLFGVKLFEIILG